jgi:hypothetical protein
LSGLYLWGNYLLRNRPILKLLLQTGEMATLGVSDLWKIFDWYHGQRSKRDGDTQRALIEWLGGVYTDLCRLSEIWSQIVVDVGRMGGDPTQLWIPADFWGVLNLQRGPE